MTTSRRYAIAFLLVGIVFVAVNGLNFLRPVTCWDCYFPYGAPFTFYQAGGYAGDAGIVWRGLVEDVAIVILASLVVARIWQALVKRSSRFNAVP